MRLPLASPLLLLALGCTEYGLSMAEDVVVAPQDAADVPGVVVPESGSLGVFDAVHRPPAGGPSTPEPEPQDPWEVFPEEEFDEHGDPLPEAHEDGGPLPGGHFDAETSSFLSPIGNGSTDGHVHQYDERYDTSGLDFFDLLHADLHPIHEDIPDPDQRFKIILANTDLSPGGRLVLNRVYDHEVADTWIPVQEYAELPLDQLPVFSFSGVDDTHELRTFGLYFDHAALEDRALVPSSTECVVSNTLGVDGAWRNGALTVQALAVDDDGVDAFGTDPALSVGGEHGVATHGLLWEATVFWHWRGPCTHEEGWDTWVPNTQGGGSAGGPGNGGNGPPH